ncbi:hypothetical protein J6590_104705 [Homalodisca vitripennis]|nr:hypothetical protein J6590_104705 [Homalodisca vitripennis]
MNVGEGGAHIVLKAVADLDIRERSKAYSIVEPIYDIRKDDKATSGSDAVTTTRPNGKFSTPTSHRDLSQVPSV